MHLSNETKILLGIILTTLVIIGGGIYLTSRPAPKIDRSLLVSEEAYTQGQKDAKNYLVEFSDFQCPACKAFNSSVNDLLKKHKSDLFFVYRHYPLPQHQFAQMAAEAAEAAGEQGKFWEMHEYLFTNQESFSEQFIMDSGKALGLDEEKFKQAVTTQKFKDKISKDQSAGDQAGLNSTPTFYLNGEKISLSSPSDFFKTVEDAMKK